MSAKSCFNKDDALSSKVETLLLRFVLFGRLGGLFLVSDRGKTERRNDQPAGAAEFEREVLPVPRALQAAALLVEHRETVGAQEALAFILASWLPGNWGLVLQRNEFEDSVRQQFHPPRKSS